MVKHSLGLFGYHDIVVLANQKNQAILLDILVLNEVLLGYRHRRRLQGMDRGRSAILFFLDI